MRFFTVALLLPAGITFAEPPPLVAVRDARIVPVSGPVLEKGTVVIKDGLIADIGTSITIPPGAWVLDGEGLTVYPGLIDALSTWGLPDATPVPTATGGRGSGPPAAVPPGASPGTVTPPARGPEDRPATTSWVKAADQVQPSDRRLEAARSAGFTSAVTFPRRGIVAGHGAVINLAGDSAGQMILHPSAALYLTLSTSGSFGSFPGSLMGTIAYLRQLWLDADHYRAATDMYAKNPSGVARPKYDRALEGVLEAKRILLPATSRVEIERMIRFAAELKTPAVLYGLHQGYRAAPALKAAGMPVIVNVKWPEKPRDADPEDIETLRALEVRDQAPSTPAALAAAGVRFAFSSDGIDAPRDLIRAVKKSIDAGLTPEQAIRALTLSAAEIYGVANRLGSIEKGKIANLTVVKGDLFDERAAVQMVFIDGVKHLPAPQVVTPPGGAPGRPTGPVSRGDANHTLRASEVNQ